MTFNSWLGEQAEREDAVGELARLAQQEDFPVGPGQSGSAKDIQAGLTAHGRQDIMASAAQAVSEYDVARQEEINAERREADALGQAEVARQEKKNKRGQSKAARDRAAQVVPDPRVEGKAKAAARDAEVAARVQADADAALQEADTGPAWTGDEAEQDDPDEGSEFTSLGNPAIEEAQASQ